MADCSISCANSTIFRPPRLKQKETTVTIENDIENFFIWTRFIASIGNLQGFSLISVRFAAKSRMSSLEFLGFIDIRIKFIIFLVVCLIQFILKITKILIFHKQFSKPTVTYCLILFAIK